jgi:hypothetical protein
MAQKPSTQRTIGEHKRNQPGFSGWWGLLVIGAIIIFGAISSSFDSKTTTAANPPVPTLIKAEMDREWQVIDTEKANAERMGRQLEDLSQELERERSALDLTSQTDVDQFNRKVSAYNDVQEKARAQGRLVNQLVDSFNEKLRKNRR